jgi:hypothetical protein
MLLGEPDAIDIYDRAIVRYSTVAKTMAEFCPHQDGLWRYRRVNLAYNPLTVNSDVEAVLPRAPKA